MSAAPQQPGRKGPKGPTTTTGDYEKFVDGALRDHVVGTNAPPTAAEIDPRELLRYAAGKANDDERTALEDFVKRSRWAFDRVVALVRCNRKNAGDGVANRIARKLLANQSLKDALLELKKDELALHGRLSSIEQEDDALLALLDAFPSLMGQNEGSRSKKKK
jgi:hypothetical protein